MPSGPDFRQMISNWAPWYMRGTVGARLLESVGALLDGIANQVDEGRRAVLPQFCQEDVLPYFSKDRGIELYTTEPADSKRFRLCRWWQLHQKRGTALGIMEHAQPYFLDQPALPRFRVVSQDVGGFRATWWTRNPDGTVERYVAAPSNWNWESSAEKVTVVPGGAHWARVWVIIYTAGTALDTSCARYGDGTQYGDGVTVYGGVGAQARADLIRMIKSWRSARTQVWGIALAHDTTSFNPAALSSLAPDGSTSLPTGSPSWLYPIDPVTNKATRLASADWIYDRTRDGA